jgi:hypothetical protein
MFYDTEFINVPVANSTFYITFLSYSPVSLTDNLLNLHYQVLLNDSCTSTLKHLTCVEWFLVSILSGTSNLTDISMLI